MWCALDFEAAARSWTYLTAAHAARCTAPHGVGSHAGPPAIRVRDGR